VVGGRGAGEWSEDEERASGRRTKSGRVVGGRRAGEWSEDEERASGRRTEGGGRVVGEQRERGKMGGWSTRT
jgi:hypothetical protein